MADGQRVTLPAEGAIADTAASSVAATTTSKTAPHSEAVPWPTARLLRVISELAVAQRVPQVSRVSTLHDSDVIARARESAPVSASGDTYRVYVSVQCHLADVVAWQHV